MKLKAMLVDFVIPASMEKWPTGEWADGSIKIKVQQQDNAGGHSANNDYFIVEALTELEVNGCFIPGKRSPSNIQPPNSPNLNILDLGLFNALQANLLQRIPKGQHGDH
jgi:hypothetical protein